MTEPRAYPGTPRWAKVFGGVLIALAVLFAILHLTDARGRHGPGRHLPFARDSTADLQEHRPTPGAHQPTGSDR